MLIYVCPSCRAKNSLDNVLHQAVEDSDARRLVEYLVLQQQPTLGAQLIRYLRLHAPPKNRLSWSRTRQVLGEIVEALKSHRIHYRGREWQVRVDDWRAALDVVFRDAEDGKLRLPLKNSHYLWGVLANIANGHEAARESAIEQARRSSGRSGPDQGARSLADVLPDAMANPQRAAPAPAAHPITEEPQPITSRFVREAREQIARTKARRERLLKTLQQQEHPETDGGNADSQEKEQ
ncbi:hypothetical protein CK623_11545 [Vandammella animalimorsus]|uniref:Uncharacterized protein n=1 Tax=Vandammella animalimorsus TaxID=2029117 RepID=A0A2A2AKT0_9BURK|nr:hypothetical protein [Vandammella animalimorsus]PAT39185.1 hypothetical protein CK623_11545 [Vandammella animalimorsus]